jgi:hypothetical protein
MYLYAHSQLYPDSTRRLWSFPFLLIFGTGIALNNTKAIIEALCNVPSPFVRTPKYRIERLSDTWIGKRYAVLFPWISLGEMALACGHAYGIWLALRQGTYLINPFFLLFMLGFATVAFLSCWEAWQGHTAKRLQQRKGKASLSHHPV